MASPGSSRRDRSRYLAVARQRCTGRNDQSCAETLLSQQDGLTLRDGRLITFDHRAQEALERCLARTFDCFATGAGPAALWVGRPEGRRPWLLTIRPLTTAFAGLARVASGFHVELLTTQPWFHVSSSLTTLFELSPREAEVLGLLAGGHSINSLAAALSISTNTAKVHLQAIFAKTQTGRQAELLQLCARIGAN